MYLPSLACQFTLYFESLCSGSPVRFQSEGADPGKSPEWIMNWVPWYWVIFQSFVCQKLGTIEQCSAGPVTGPFLLCMLNCKGTVSTRVTRPRENSRAFSGPHCCWLLRLKQPTFGTFSLRACHVLSCHNLFAFQSATSATAQPALLDLTDVCFSGGSDGWTIFLRLRCWIAFKSDSHCFF